MILMSIGSKVTDYDRAMNNQLYFLFHTKVKFKNYKFRSKITWVHITLHNFVPQLVHNFFFGKLPEICELQIGFKFIQQLTRRCELF